MKKFKTLLPVFVLCIVSGCLLLSDWTIKANEYAGCSVDTLIKKFGEPNADNYRIIDENHELPPREPDYS